MISTAIETMLKSVDVGVIQSNCTHFLPHYVMAVIVVRSMYHGLIRNTTDGPFRDLKDYNRSIAGNLSHRETNSRLLPL